MTRLLFFILAYLINLYVLAERDRNLDRERESYGNHKDLEVPTNTKPSSRRIGYVLMPACNY